MSSTSNGRILLADDEESIVESLAAQLRRTGYECTAKMNGAAVAAELNSSSPYDLLIADIRMEGNAKLELVKHLLEIAADLPVILMTGYPSLESAVGSADLGVFAYLVKPVKLDELLPLVHRAVAQSTMRRANNEIERRLNDWIGETKTLQQILSRGSSGSTVSPEAFVNLAMRQILGCVSELNDLWRKTSANEPQRLAVNQFESTLSAALNAFEASAPVAGANPPRPDHG